MNVMLEMQLKQAKTKLEKHKQLGNRSTMSILEVARLMDFICSYEDQKEQTKVPVFFSYSLN